MNRHDEIREALDDYVDGLLGDTERADIDRHLAACDECRAELQSIRRLQARTQDLPKSVRPGRELWPDIRASLRPREARQSRPLGWLLRPRGALALAATAAVAIVAIIALQPRFTPDRAPLATDARPEMSTYVPDVVHGLERQCSGAAKQLFASSVAWKSMVGSETTTSVSTSLRELDQAIAETLNALTAYPDDPGLVRMLTEQYQRKLDVMHDAIRLAGVA